MPAQHFKYKHIRKRIKRTFYYGRNDRMDQLSLPLNELSQQYFDKHAPFDYLDMKFATNLSKEGCVSPCSLIVAMIYMDRFRSLNKDRFEASDPSDIYMSALLVASKYLNDEGETDYVYNDEWAASAQRSLKHINEKEIELLTGIDWKLMVHAAEFYQKLKSMETDVARSEVRKRELHGSMSYTELDLLSERLDDNDFLWATFLQPFLAVISLASLVYSASILALYAATVTVSCFPPVPRLPQDTHSPSLPTMTTHAGTQVGYRNPSSPNAVGSIEDSCLDIGDLSHVSIIDLDLDIMPSNVDLIGDTEEPEIDYRKNIDYGDGSQSDNGMNGFQSHKTATDGTMNESDVICDILGLNFTEFKLGIGGFTENRGLFMTALVGSG